MSSPHQGSKPENSRPLPPPDLELAILPTQAPPQPPNPPSKLTDRFLVTFTTPDPTNPKDWPNRLKWSVTDVLSATGFNRIMVSTIMAPALSTIALELHMSHVESVMTLSIYLLATAFGPLVIGPLSEVYGRQKILHASNVWTKEVLIAARFLAGFGASSIYALAGGVYLLIPLLGAAVGPIISSFLAGQTTWRWMFWSMSIFQAVMIAVSFAAFKETYAPRMVAGQSILSVLGNALTRPLRLLLFHPIIVVASVNLALDYGILYIVLTSFAELWTNYYHDSVEISGLHYLAVALGELAGAQIGAPMIDRFYRRKKAQHPDGDLAPEYRLPVIFPGGSSCTKYRVHWVAVDIGVFIAMFGSQMSGMVWQAYIMDAYSDHTSSARAATQFSASLTAFLFPLFVPTMYKAMGYGWGNTAMAFASLILAVPGPIVLWYYGAKLRTRARSTY
ncbi:MFS general substrate transporter [Lizonia empirigonia]|nr:MFS general substrate transporter [Lizonia empirigonia]